MEADQARTMMSLSATAVFCSIFFGLAAFMGLAAIADLIQARVDRQWAMDAEQHARFIEQPASRPVVTLVHKAMYAVVAVALSGTIFVWSGEGAEGLALATYFFALLLLAVINVRSGLLPDLVVIPMLWVALVYYTYTGSGADHVYGAVVGYIVPFLVTLAIKLTQGRELMGQGDIKAFSMAGAWLGLAALPWTGVGFVVGAILWALVTKGFRKDSPGWVHTGPAHIVASLAAVVGMRAF